MDDLRTCVINTSDVKELRRAAGLSRQHWWGPTYPKDPLEDLRRAKFLYGMYNAKTLIGMVGIFNLSEYEISHLVIHPNYRGKRIGTVLYNLAVGYIRKQGAACIVTHTENLMVKQYLVRLGWIVGFTRIRLDGLEEWVLRLENKK